MNSVKDAKLVYEFEECNLTPEMIVAIDSLINRISELEKIRQFYADPTIYDSRHGMAILKDCGDKAREGLK
ncbi:hypothetical protein M3210_02895 [Oceanobacillus luteolus]|uniref:hypothetical protein n=1 Tax=Oceanobacillus luteolus TaxID=1274358 RepID=UPI00203AD4D2|nr:hypothetical protein [Oceanobacillus luteolus]MCM3739210.1 hypothetical protein [Oceanobacillus luteolus]